MATPLFFLLAVLSVRLGAAHQAEPAPVPAPPFPSRTSDWIGTPPSWAGLRGRVVLLNVWTFG